MVTMLLDKIEVLIYKIRIKLQEIVSLQKKYERNHEECVQKIEQLTCKIEQINAKREAMEKEKESLNKSDAVALKMRDSVLSKELEEQRRNKDDKEKFLASKQEQWLEIKSQVEKQNSRKGRAAGYQRIS